MKSRIISALFLLLFTTASASQLLVVLRDGPLVDFAIETERGSAPVPPTIELVDRLQIEFDRRSGCARNLARSRVAISLYLLSFAGKGNSDIHHRLAIAQTEARVALSCNPMDGNLWLVAGWLNYHSVPNKALLQEFVLNAIRFAPTGAVALQRRWQVLAPQLSALGFGRDPLVFSDLVRLLREVPAAFASTIYQALSLNGAGRLAGDALREAGPSRQADIMRQLESSAPQLHKRETDRE